MLYQPGSFSAQPASKASAKAAAAPSVMPPLSNLVTVPPQTDAFARTVAEGFIAICAATEAARADAHSAFCAGRGGDNPGSAAYATALAAIEAQCSQLARTLQQPGAGAAAAHADDDPIVLDESPRSDGAITIDE